MDFPNGFRGAVIVYSAPIASVVRTELFSEGPQQPVSIEPLPESDKIDFPSLSHSS